VPLARLFRTSSFRLTLLYAALFSTSALLLFAVIFWTTSFYMTNQLDDAIDSDRTELQQGLSTGGLPRLSEMIRDRVDQMPLGPIVYLLQDAGGAVLAGNLPSMQPRTGTFDFDLPAPRAGHLHSIRARGVVLPSGDYLVVGADAHPLDEMREWILRAFGWGFAITLLLAFGGGALISNGLLRRVETISRAARAIMEGNLSRRIPARGVDDEFDHLAGSLNAMLERTERSIEGMRQVSSDIAHDLRTPLTRLRQHLELGRRRARSLDELRIAIDRSIAEVDDILETFGALLRIAQVESSAHRDHFGTVDFSELLNGVAELYHPMAEEKRQRFAVEIEPRLCLFGDRELVAQMVANLLENAMRHSPAEASIALTARRMRDDIEIAVADNGPGIPASERDKVFRRFYRLEASRTTPGSGLGLSLVAAVAALHGAEITLADNNPGLRAVLRFVGRQSCAASTTSAMRP
jgi:signal transduction histidine kinase